VKDYLPDEQDWHQLDRKWLCDLLYSRCTEDFDELVHESLESKRAKHIEKHSMVLDMQPDFYDALKNTVAFASKHHRHDQSYR
jgi:hypothetical protein